MKISPKSTALELFKTQYFWTAKKIFCQETHFFILFLPISSIKSSFSPFLHYDSTLWEGCSHSLFLRPCPIDGNGGSSLDVATHSQGPAGPPWLMMTPGKKKVGLFHHLRGVPKKLSSPDFGVSDKERKPVSYMDWVSAAFQIPPVSSEIGENQDPCSQRSFKVLITFHDWAWL